MDTASATASAAEDAGGGPIPPVQIRIRKGSDAPSLGETKLAQNAAPLASFEALSDISDWEESDAESRQSDTDDAGEGGGGDDVFGRSKSPNLTVPSQQYQRLREKREQEDGDDAASSDTPTETSDMEDGEKTPTEESPTPARPPPPRSPSGGGVSRPPPPRGHSPSRPPPPSAHRGPKTPDYGDDDEPELNTNLQIAEPDPEPADTSVAAPGLNELEAIYGSEATDGDSGENNTGNANNSTSNIDDLLGFGLDSGASAGRESPRQQADKIKIVLPGQDKKSGPARPPPPKPAPPRPKPPQTKPQSGKKWESFEGSSSAPTSSGPPGRPSKPPSRPPAFTKGDSIETADLSSFDEESALCDPASPTEKKSKSKVFSPKKLVASANPKKFAIKSPKKEKKSKNKPEEPKKFVPYEQRLDKNSEEWKIFQSMQERIQMTMQSTQETITKKESDFEQEFGKLATAATNSPWAALGLKEEETSEPKQDSPMDSKPDPKALWEGFEDSFTVTPNMDVNQKLSHLNVTPVPSPKRVPVPPNNSRQGSSEDLHKKAQRREMNGEADLLGLSEEKDTQSGDTGAQTQKPSATSDLLGLDSIDLMQSETSGLDKTDLMSMSRNPVDSARSSGKSSPNALDQDLAALGITSSDQVTAPESSMSLVDDFLGISQEQAVSAPKPKDPMDMLTSMKAAKEEKMAENKALETNADIFGLGTVDSAKMDSTPATLDDFLGPPVEKATVPVSGDLFEASPTTETAKDGDVFTVDTEKLKMMMMPPPPTKAEIQELNLAADTFISKDDVVSPLSDEFDPRADISEDKLKVKPLEDSSAGDVWAKSTVRTRKRPQAQTAFSSAAGALPPPGSIPPPSSSKKDATDTNNKTQSANPFATESSAGENLLIDTEAAEPPVCEDTGLDMLGETVSAAQAVAGDNFDIFATITEGEPPHPHPQDDNFDPFETIQGDDAFVAHFPTTDDELDSGATPGSLDEGTTSPRINPFDKEPPLDEKFANFEPQENTSPKKQDSAAKVTSSESSFDEVEDLEPLAPFLPSFDGEGWNLFLRQPIKKKLTQNRFWKPVYVRLVQNKKLPTIQLFHNEKERQPFHELMLQPSYTICDMGLQQYDQFGKCHTLKIQYVFYKERPGVKAERLTPTLSDLTRVRDLKGLKDLVHKPKTTMILEHAPQASELMKFGSLNYEDFKCFHRELEDILFRMEAQREGKTLTYTKDEITVDIVDEYVVDIDRFGHITDHKARVRIFSLAFLTGNPMVELGVNDKRRRGKEVVGRHDIIPIKTEEWIRIEDHECHSTVDVDEFEKAKVIKYRPLDACYTELMRFRTRPRLNKELPLQIRVQMSVLDHHVEIRSDIIIPGYYSNSRRAAQTPCEDISIRFPIPEPWIYYFRVEKRFRYGAVKATTRKPGKIKGLERLTMMAQGMMTPSLIEVSSGTAKYEHLFHAVVWRIARLPERNQGAYKTHLFVLKLDLGPHDPIPEEYDKTIHVSYNMPNSTVSRAQVRSISINSEKDDPPDRWVHHLARYQYDVEIEFQDEKTKAPLEGENGSPTSPRSPTAPEALEEANKDQVNDDDSDSSSSDSD